MQKLILPENDDFIPRSSFFQYGENLDSFKDGEYFPVKTYVMNNFPCHKLDKRCKLVRNGKCFYAQRDVWYSKSTTVIYFWFDKDGRLQEKSLDYFCIKGIVLAYKSADRKYLLVFYNELSGKDYEPHDDEWPREQWLGDNVLDPLDSAIYKFDDTTDGQYNVSNDLKLKEITDLKRYIHHSYVDFIDVRISPDNTTVWVIVKKPKDSESECYFLEKMEYKVDCNGDVDLKVISQTDICKKLSASAVIKTAYDVECHNLYAIVNDFGRKKNRVKLHVYSLIYEVSIASVRVSPETFCVYVANDFKHGEFAICLDSNAEVNVFCMDLVTESLTNYCSFSLVDLLEGFDMSCIDREDFIENIEEKVIVVSNGMARIFVAGDCRHICVVCPFMKKCITRLTLSSGFDFSSKNIFVNWPGDEVAVIQNDESEEKDSFLSYFNIGIRGDFTLKELAALKVVKSYSLHEIRNMNLPKPLKYLFNIISYRIIFPQRDDSSASVSSSSYSDTSIEEDPDTDEDIETDNDTDSENGTDTDNGAE